MTTRESSLRVAKELGVRLGEEVGYSVGGENMTTRGKAIIQFMTDGYMMQQAYIASGEDGLAEQYSTIIVDVFHRGFSHRGQLPPGSDLASLFGESNDGATLSAILDIEVHLQVQEVDCRKGMLAAFKMSSLVPSSELVSSWQDSQGDAVSL